MSTPYEVVWMPPALQFVIYLLAVLAFVAAAAWGVVRRPFDPVNAIGVGLALVTVVPLVQAGQAAF
jgi:flagellar biogenesis protein FliO